MRLLWNIEESGNSIWNERYMHALVSARIYSDRQKKRRSIKEEDGTSLYGSRPVVDADIF